MLEHIAIWTSDLEEMKTFYCSYFNGQAGKNSATTQNSTPTSSRISSPLGRGAGLS